MSKSIAATPLQQKVSVTLLFVFTSLAVLCFGVLKTVIAPAFDTLELDAAETNLLRAERAVQADLASVRLSARDWAPWDDAYRYVSGENPAFAASNLNDGTLTALDLDLMLFYRFDRSLVWGRLLVDGASEDLGALRLFELDASPTTDLIVHHSIDSEKEGIVRTDWGPLYISSLPILTTDRKGPIAGTVVMGRFLDEELQAALRERTAVDLRWDVLESLAADGADRVVGDHAIASRRVLNDIFGEPYVVLETRTERAISAVGNQTIRGALVMFAAVGVILSVLAWFMLRHIIVRPLESIADYIIRMRKSGDLTEPMQTTRNDEIGLVARELDKLTAEVHEARELLLERSFKAGKADTAAEVLHNIRNAMTPLINGIERLSIQFRAADRLRVHEAMDQLQDDRCPEERRQKLIQYVDSAFSHVEAVGEEALDGMTVVSKQARQIEAILADQERHANVAPVFEILSLNDLVDEAALVLPSNIDGAIVLDVGDEVRSNSVYAHRVGLLQVLGNLILNAYESIVRRGGEGRIRVSATPETVDDRDMVRVTVSDDGSGFDESTGRKIFQRGFSSKQGHLSGLGLHWCANALGRMGGRIVAESGGPDQGADFHVLLPAARRLSNERTAS